MAEAEIEKASTEISNALRANFRWHDNFTAMESVPRINTNIGIFIFYGMRQPVEVASAGEIRITEAKPHSATLIACSLIPTTQQKVLLLDLISTRVARKLGIPASAPVAKKDPLRPEGAGAPGGLIGLTLGRAAAQTEQALEAGEFIDPYKSIKEPYQITVTWKPEGGFEDKFTAGNAGRR